jgi:hypothetical protein
MGEHRTTTELREHLKLVAKEDDTMTRSNRDRRGARKVRTKSAEPAYTGIINVYRLINRDDTVEKEKERLRTFIPKHITPDQLATIQKDANTVGLYNQLIVHGRPIPTSDIPVPDDEAECQKIINEYITNGSNPKNVLFQFRRKSGGGWYGQKLSAHQMLQLVKLFPGIAHGSYDTENTRAGYTQRGNGPRIFYIKREVADLLKKMGMQIPRDTPQQGTATPVTPRRTAPQPAKPTPPDEKKAPAPVSQPAAPEPYDDASDVLTFPGEEAGPETSRRGRRVPAAVNRTGVKKQGNPVFGRMASLIGTPTVATPVWAVKQTGGPGMIATAKKASGCMTPGMSTRKNTPVLHMASVVGVSPKKTAGTQIAIAITPPSLLKKGRRFR